jgi:DNA modification methylase
MTPYYQDLSTTVYAGDALTVLRQLPAERVHCVVTSPPYWGLRDYGTATWDGGAEDCDHRQQLGGEGASSAKQNTSAGTQTIAYRDACGKCGARRTDAQLGLESTPEEYVARMVEVFREVRRVLRDDGTCWVNMGDSYATGGGRVGEAPGGGKQGEAWRLRGIMTTPNRLPLPGLKSKDLVGIPWRLAFALQADGWYLRSDIIWAKPNPMPESVTDRPTKSHEYLFLLSKRATYYYDAEAVREPAQYGRRPMPSASWDRCAVVPSRVPGRTGGPGDDPEAGRNLRTVWTIATHSFPDAHFATFPPALVVPCVKAGTSERGVCPACGAPWERVVYRGFVGQSNPYGPGQRIQGNRTSLNGRNMAARDTARDVLTRWRPTCACGRPDTIPATVLDPFAGALTTCHVAKELGRRSIGIDLNPAYLDMGARRLAQEVLPL